MQHEAMAVYGAILKRQKAAAEASATPANVGKPGAEEDRADAKRRDGKGHSKPTAAPPEEDKADAPPDHGSKGKPKPKVDKAAKDAQKRG